MNNESAGRHLCMDDVEVIHAWLESGYGGCWTLPLETDGEQLEGVAVKVPGSRLGLGTYAVVMAGKFVNGGHFRTKRQLFIRLVDREDQADAKPTMFNEEKAYWAGPAVLSGMLSRDGLNTYELAVLHGFEGTLETFLAQQGIELQDLMVTKAKLSREVQTQLDKGSEKAINPAGDYDAEAEYSVNEMVYDEETNSSYVSKQSENVGHAVTDTDWWMKVLDGNYVQTTIQAIMTAAQETLDEAKQDTIDATAAALAAKQDTEQATAAANAVVAQKVADAQIGYYVCETAAGTATKQTTSDVIGEDHFAVPSAGGAVKVSMKYANTSTDAVYLQFGTNTNTKRKLYYNGEAASNSNTWDDGEVISVYLDPAANNGAGGYMASNAQGGGGNDKKKLIGANGYINTSGVFTDPKGAIPAPSSSQSYVYFKQAVNEGDVLLISGEGSGTENGLLWAYGDVEGNYVTGSDLCVRDENILLIIPEGVKWVVLNHKKASTITPAWYYAKAGSSGAQELMAQAYLSHNTRRLTVGQPYTRNETVIDSENYLLRMTDDVTELNLTDKIVSGDLKTDKTGTYKAIANVSLYTGSDEDYQSGDYAIADGVIKTFDGSAWTAATIANMVDDSNLFEALTNEDLTAYTQVDDVRSAVRDSVSVRRIYTAKDCEEFVVAAASTVDNFPNATRVRLVKKVTAGTKVTAYSNAGKGAAVGLFDSKEGAILCTAAHKIYGEADWHKGETITLTAPVDGWLTVSLARTNDAKMGSYPEYVLALVKNLTLTIDGYFPKDNIEDSNAIVANELPLYIGEVEQNVRASNGNYYVRQSSDHVYHDSCVLMRDVITVPYEGTKIRLKVPDNIYVFVYSGDRGDMIDTKVAGGPFGNGDVIEIPKMCYSLQFMRNNDVSHEYTSNSSWYKYPLLPEEISEMIANGDIQLLYENKDDDNILSRNHEAEKILKSLQHTGAEVASGGIGIQDLHNLPIITHTSDAHGDAYRLRNFYEFSDFIEADYAAITGDMVNRVGADNCRYMYELDNTYKTKMLFSIGNHDAEVANAADTPNKLYNLYLKELHEKYNYECPYIESVVDEETVNLYRPYYYIDDTKYGLRFISLCVHDLGCDTSNARFDNSITEFQINWLINTLANTPEGYGVIILYHDPEKKVINEANNKFMQSGLTVSNYKSWLEWSRMTFTDGIMPITHIVNGFIRHESGGGSYKNDTSALINYEFDFSNITTQKFICHVCGHEHADAVGYYVGFDGSVEGKNKQIILSVPCTQANYDPNGAVHASLCDVPRGGVGLTQDCFNCYVIDKENELIHIVRVGSNLAYGNRDRDYMSISYSQD